MKNLVFILFLLCLAQKTTAQPVVEFTSDYIALTVPQQYNGQIWYIDTATRLQSLKYIDQVKNDNTLLSSFANIVSNVTIYQVSKGGDLTVVGIGVSAKDELYQVIYDFSQSQTLIHENDTSGAFSALVGVGVRMVAKVRTKKAGINLTSPFSLGANYDKLEGSLEVRVTGINSQKINGLIPTTTDLSPASISVALQSVATIKSHMYDDDTIIIPQYLAYNKRNKTGEALNTGLKANVNKEQH